MYLLPDQDSNLDKRYQKPLYYLYTIGQSSIQTVALKWNANVRTFFTSANPKSKKNKIISKAILITDKQSIFYSKKIITTLLH